MAKRRHFSVEIRIRKLKQLFNSFDPSPFIEKDLDDKAFEYIVSSVKEHNLKDEGRIVIHLPKREKKKVPEENVISAIKHNLEFRKKLEERDIKRKLVEGQKSMTVGLTFLAICLFLRQLILSFEPNLFLDVFSEGLLIVGWVAMWKPISNILYDWVPLKKDIHVFEKIHDMPIHFVYE